MDSMTGGNLQLQSNDSSPVAVLGGMGEPSAYHQHGILDHSPWYHLGPGPFIIVWIFLILTAFAIIFFSFAIFCCPVIFPCPIFKRRRSVFYGFGLPRIYNNSNSNRNYCTRSSRRGIVEFDTPVNYFYQDPGRIYSVPPNQQSIPMESTANNNYYSSSSRPFVASPVELIPGKLFPTFSTLNNAGAVYSTPRV